MAPETEDTLLGRARFLCREDSAQPHLFLMLRMRRLYRKDEEAGPKVQWPFLGPQGDGEIYGWAGDEMVCMLSNIGFVNALGVSWPRCCRAIGESK